MWSIWHFCLWLSAARLLEATKGAKTCTGTMVSSTSVTGVTCPSTIPLYSWVKGTEITTFGTYVSTLTGSVTAGTGVVTLSSGQTFSASVAVTLTFSPPTSFLNLFAIFNLKPSALTPIFTDAEQQLQAFLMAIKEINDDTQTTLLPNYHLQFKMGDSQSSFFTACSRAMTPAKQVTNYPYYRALFTSVSDSYIEAISSMLNEGEQFKELFYMVTNARTTYLSKGREHPYKGRLIPPITHSGDVFSSVAGKRLNFKRVAVISTVDYFAAISLEGFLAGNTFQILSKQIVQSGAGQDFSSEIRAVKDSGARIILVFADAATTADIIGQGMTKGMVKEGSLLFIHEAATTATMINSIKSNYPNVDLTRLSKTLLGVQHNSRYGLKSTAKGSSFLSSWTAQTPTQSPSFSPTSATTPTCPPTSRPWNSPASGTLPPTDCGCDFETVPTNSPSMNPTYSVPTPAPVFYTAAPNPQTCAGITDFASVTADTIDPNAPYVYDSVYAVAHALHYLLETRQLTPNETYPTANDMMDALINHVSFEGASGPVSFSKGLYREDGLPTADLIGKGDRLNGHAFDLVKYSTDAVSTAPWVAVGLWSGDSVWQLCDENADIEVLGVTTACGTEKFVYSTANGLRPKDRYDDVHLEMTPGLVGFLVFLGTAGLLIVIVLSLYLLVHKKNKHVKNAQPPMLAMVLLGQLLAAIRVIIGTRKPETNPWVCHASLWIGHIAFVLLYGGLCLKMWRVDKVINIRSIKRVKITDRDMMLFGSLLVLVVAGLLIIVSVHGHPHVELSVETLANVDTYINECRQDVPDVEHAMYAIEAAFLLWGIRLCNATKDAPSSVNESLAISVAATIIIVLAGAIIPIAYLVNLDPVSVDVLAAFGFGIGQISTTLIIFLPKALSIFRGEETGLKADPSKFTTKPGLSSMSTSSLGKEGASSSAGLASRLETNSADLQQACAKALHGIGVDDKFAMAHGQIAYWRRILMIAEEHYNSQGHSMKNSSVASTAETEEEENSYNRYQVSSTEVEGDNNHSQTASESAAVTDASA